MEPLISVVMPVYNGEKYLSEAIESIINQTEIDFEFIIVNDGSTDNSHSIIDKYHRTDHRIKVINQENQGLIPSLNTAIEKAKGKYIARMDADDVSLPLRFEKQLELCEKNNLDICGCHFIVINEKNEKLTKTRVIVDSKLFGIALVRSVPFAHGSVIFNRSFYLKNKLFYGNTNYSKAEDYALWCQFYECNATFGNVDDYLFKYRNVNGSLSSDKYNLIHASCISSRFIDENEIRILSEIKVIDFKECKLLFKNIAYFLISTLHNGFFKKVTIMRKLPIHIIFSAFLSKLLIFLRQL